jgi:hypothetical protein
MEPEGSLPCSQEPAVGPVLSQIIPAHPAKPYVSKIWKWLNHWKKS